MTLNLILLSVFAKNLRLSHDIQSMRLRYQALSVIYINLLCASTLTLMNFFHWTSLLLPSSFHATTYFYPLICISLTLLRQGKIEGSCITSSLCMLGTNLIGSDFGREPGVGAIGIFAVSVMNFFLAYSLRVYVLTTTLSAGLFGVYLYRINQMIRTTINDQQSNQISASLIVGSSTFLLTTAAFLVQKNIETILWETATNNYTRSEALTKEVLQASQAKDAFVSSLSHEIRNPLNSLKGSIDYLLDTIIQPDHVRMLQNAKLSSEIIVNLANNVMDAAKLRADKMDLSFSATDFALVIKKVFSINSEVLKTKKVYASALLDENLPKVLWTDMSRMLQIMMNLVSNALKFTPEGGRVTVTATWCPSNTDVQGLLKPVNYIDTEHSPVSLASSRGENRQDSFFVFNESVQEFTAEKSKTRPKNMVPLKYFTTKSSQEVFSLPKTEPWAILEYCATPYQEQQQQPTNQGYLKLQVSDTGCGIAQENIPKLFQMFTQAHKSVSTMHGGTGLGLWICKQLCQKMGGDIKLYSQPERGATFVFYIPIDNDQMLMTSQSKTGFAHHGLNVMIVDDYSHNRELHKLLVEREGAHAVLASDGQEAVEKFKRYEEGYFSFIMMDVKMFDASGFTAAKLIREWEREQRRGKKVDIYLVSGEYFDEDEVLAAFKAIEGGGDRTGLKCMRKPIDLESIKEAVLRYKDDMKEIE